MLLVIVVLLVFGLTMVFGYKIAKDINTDIQADDDIAPEGKEEMQSFTTNYPQFMDNAFVLLLTLLWVALIVTSFLVDSHPVFFILTVILLVFVFIVGMILANTYQDVTGDADLSTEAADFTMTRWVFENFLVIVIAMGFSTAIALYAKARI